MKSKIKGKAAKPLCVPRLRPRSPFRDFHNRPAGGAHADRRKILEALSRVELRDAGRDD